MRILSGFNLSLVFGFLFTTTINAQDATSTFLRSGVGDANKLIGAYAEPLLQSFGAGLNSGWFQTAKPHGALGMSLTISSNFILVPNDAKTFDINSLGLSPNVRLVSGSNITPTVFGNKNNNSDIGLYARVADGGPDTLLLRQPLPSGTGLSFLPLPTAQFSIGIGLNSELSIRFLPEIKSGDYDVNMIGFGGKFEFKEWIPVMKKMPFNLSAQFGFTQFNAYYKPSQLQAQQSDNYTYNPNNGKQYNNQELTFESTAWTANLIISKKLAFFTPYLGVGYQQATTKLNLEGEYPVTDVNQNVDYTAVFGTPNYNANNANSHPLIVREIKDPVAVSATLSGLRATAGFRLKFTVFTLHADYTMSAGGFNVVSAGLGLNVQSLLPPKL